MDKGATDMTIRKGLLDRRDILSQLFPTPHDWLFVSGLAGASKDAAKLTQDGGNLFSMAGTMGAAVPMGLGLALAAPQSQVAVVTGDGEMLMGLGSLITVASQSPSNLAILVIDNAMHGETGKQTGHTNSHANLELLAKGSGLKHVMTIAESHECEDARAFLHETQDGPRMLIARVLPTNPSSYKRNMDPNACRHRFRDAFQARV